MVKDIIRSNRLRLGMTMKELADKVGVSEATISRWESGEISNMKRSGISALAEALEISPMVVMGWDEEKHKENYYLNPESAKIAQEAFENSELRILFDAARNVSPEDLKYVIDLVKRLEKEENPDPEDFPDEVYDDDFNQDPGDD